MRTLLITEPFCPEHIEKMTKVAEGFETIVLPRGVDESILKDALLKAEIIVGQPPIEMILNPETDCPNLKLIQMTWAGTDQYTCSDKEFPKDSITLANASGAYGLIMSQFVVGMMLSTSLNFMYYHNQQLQKIWKRGGALKSLDGARVLIYGAGDIGGSVAKRLQGFNAYTIGVCRNTSRNRPYFNELCTLEDAEKHLGEVDYIVCCMPNSDDSRGYFDERRLRMVKKDGVIVNVGRGNFIDCDALNEVLNDGHLWGAALDVTNPEPLPVNHPLWENPRAMITPHTTGAAFGQLDKTDDLICDIACENIKRHINGEEIKNSVFG